MWIAEAEGVPAVAYDTEQEARTAAGALVRGVFWELADEGEK